MLLRPRPSRHKSTAVPRQASTGQTIRTRLSLLGALLFLMTLIVPANPVTVTQAQVGTIHTVCASGCDFTSISAAITAAANDDAILVGAGDYQENLTINKSVTIHGVGADLVTIRGAGIAAAPYSGAAPSVVTVTTGSVGFLSGVTITGGSGTIFEPANPPADGSDMSGRRIGGGVYVEYGADFTLSHSVVRDNLVSGDAGEAGGTTATPAGGNWSPMGGGIYNTGAMTVTHSQIVENSVVGGAGGGNAGGGGGAFGGGIYNASDPDTGDVLVPSLVITQTGIYTNTATGGTSGSGGGGAALGGGVFSASNLTMGNNTITGNIVQGGGGEDNPGRTQRGGGGGYGSDATNAATSGTGGFGGGGGTGFDGGFGGYGGGGGAGVDGGPGGNGGYGGGGGGSVVNTGGTFPVGEGGYAAGNGGVYGSDTGAELGGGGGGAGLGGGVFLSSLTTGAASFNSNTFAFNSAQGGDASSNVPDAGSIAPDAGNGQGGGLFFAMGIAQFYNNILIGNSVSSGSGEAGTNSDQVTTGPNCMREVGSSFSVTQTRNNTVDDDAGCAGVAIFEEASATLGDLADNGGPTATHLILTDAGSIIDKVVSAPEVSVDQRDINRPQGSAPDRGSVEMVTTSNAPALGGIPASQDFVAGGGAIVLADAATASDSDSSDFSLDVVIGGTFATGEDVLGMDTTTGDGLIFESFGGTNNYIFYDGVVVGTYSYDAATGTLTVDFNANDTISAVQEVLRRVTYNNTASTPTAGQRVITFTLTDGEGNDVTADTLVDLLPEIVVLDGAVEIADGGSLDLGTTAVGSPVLSKTLTISNTGNVSLGVSNPTIDDDTFTIVGFPSSVAANETETFTVTMDTSTAGTFTGELAFDTTDSDENPFNITVSGTVTGPEIEVTQDGAVVSPTTTIDFGGTTSGNPVSKTFIVENTGNENLELTSLTLPSGFNSPDFTDNTTVASGNTYSFDIQLDAASGSGTFSGTVQLATNDFDENPFEFDVVGSVDQSDISVAVDGVGVQSGDTVDFGTAFVNDPVISKTVTISNTGVVSLTLNSITEPTGYTVTGFTDGTELAPDAETQFTVSLDTSVVGTLNGALVIDNTSPGEESFTINLTGTVEGNEIFLPFISTP